MTSPPGLEQYVCSRMAPVGTQHTEFKDALRGDDEMIVGGEPFSPRLHVAMHQVVASQLLAGDPPQTWQTVQRLAGLGYDWHNIMHISQPWSATTSTTP